MARQHFPLCLTHLHYVLLISCAPPKVPLTFWNALSVELCTFDLKFKPDFFRRGHLILKCLVVWKLQYVFERCVINWKLVRVVRKLVSIGGKEGSWLV